MGKPKRQITENDLVLQQLLEGDVETYDNTAEHYETLWDTTIEYIVEELSISLELLKDKDRRQFIAPVDKTSERIERCYSLLKRLITVHQEIDKLHRSVTKGK